MSTAEMLETRGAARTLTQVLTVRFGPLPENMSRAVQEASSDQLERWTTRAVTVATLDEVFD